MKNGQKPSLSEPVFWLAVTLLILIAAGRIASTWSVFSEAFDEAPHIAAGMECVQNGTYNYERKHTPLARIAFALPLYLRGIRGTSFGDINQITEEGHHILYSGDYFTNLAWARSGNLPFFILANVFLALWAKRWFGPWTAIAAVALFSGLPPILGHSGVATTDLPAACGMVISCYAFCVWLEKPDLRRTVSLGLALAFGLLCKVSIAPFFALGALLTLMFAWWRKLPVGFRAPVPIVTQIRNLAIGTAVACLAIWAPYHFRMASISTGHGYRPAASGLSGRLLNLALDTKIPLGEFIGGLASAATFNKFGYPVFFMGSARQWGWWYYFPVMIGLKTPITFLILTLIGVGLSLKYLRSERWQRGVPFCFASGTLLICMSSSLNLGVRYILPIYPLFALMAAQALVFLFEAPRRLMRGFGVLLVLAFAAESIAAHPDYLAYFNALAGPNPERIVVGTDLDWGQDLQRLSSRLKALGVDHLSILYSGNSDLTRFSLPPFVEFGADDHPTGWVAVSATRMMLDCAHDGKYCEWKDKRPRERIGKSIFLFYVVPDVK